MYTTVVHGSERLTWRAVDCPVGDVAADGSRDGRGDGSSDTAAAHTPRSESAV